MSDSIRVAIAEDSAILRDGLVQLWPIVVSGHRRVEFEPQGLRDSIDRTVPTSP